VYLPAPLFPDKRRGSVAAVGGGVRATLGAGPRTVGGAPRTLGDGDPRTPSRLVGDSLPELQDGVAAEGICRRCQCLRAAGGVRTQEPWAGSRESWVRPQEPPGRSPAKPLPVVALRGVAGEDGHRPKDRRY
jgi:hypothetical protein